jgi:hypothetical protein
MLGFVAGSACYVDRQNNAEQLREAIRSYLGFRGYPVAKASPDPQTSTQQTAESPVITPFSANKGQGEPQQPLPAKSQRERQQDGIEGEAKAIGVMMDILRTSQRLPTLKQIAEVLDVTPRTLRNPNYAAFRKAWKKEKASRAAKPRQKAEKRK